MATFRWRSRCAPPTAGLRREIIEAAARVIKLVRAARWRYGALLPRSRWKARTWTRCSGVDAGARHACVRARRARDNTTAVIETGN